MSLTASPEQLEQVVRQVAAAREAWGACDLSRRTAYLGECRRSLVEVTPAWIEAARVARNLTAGSHEAAEEWFTGPALVASCLRMLEETLKAGGRPRVPLREGPGGRWLARAWPRGLKDRLLWAGFRGDVWLSSPLQGLPEGPARVGMVLGAGNIGSIPATDVLSKMFLENQVVVLKMNPVNEHLGPVLERVFEPLIRDGFLGIVYGGVEVGRRLVDHPAIEVIHLTGSERTHDAIVWGEDDEEQKRRKAEGSPRTTRPVTSELGGCTPILAVPGPWSEGDLAFQARHVASMKAHNGGFDCVAAQLLVTAREWSLREPFLEQLRGAFQRIPQRVPYYPGARERWSAAPDGQCLGADPGPEKLPYKLVAGLDPDGAGWASSQEMFCPVLAEVSLPTRDPADFLRQAVQFVNERVQGTLSCVLLVHPQTAREHARELERAVEDLRYGTIGVNFWGGAMFGLMGLSWGAYPGHTLEDIGSGRGVVHNCLGFRHPEKSVAWAPFRIFPAPAWFADHRNLDALGRRFAAYESHPSWWNWIRLVLAALPG